MDWLPFPGSPNALITYSLGVTFDLVKGSLLIAVLALWDRRSFLFAEIFGLIWALLVTYSCLATHATVNAAIAGIERTGTQKMEIRGNSKTELAAIDLQLDALSHPMPPRPTKTVRAAMAATSVPPATPADIEKLKQATRNNRASE